MAHWVPAAIDEGIEIAVIAGLGAAKQGGLILKPQGDVAFDLDRASEIATRREANRAATTGGAIINRLLDICGVERRAVADYTCFRCINHLVRSGHHRQHGQHGQKKNDCGEESGLWHYS